MDATDPTTRLTEREKEVLRAWLGHKTAKEIAIDLGISHHAVEKRLKMARTKLDVPTSVHAARLLALSEGYDQAVPLAPDLDRSPQIGDPWWARPLVKGIAIMSLLAAAAVFMFFSPSENAETALKPGDLLLVAPTPFDQLDEDGSGFLEGNEAPALIRASGNPSYTPKKDGTAELTADAFVIVSSGLRDSFYQEADADGDRRVSPAEYAAWAKSAKR